MGSTVVIYRGEVYDVDLGDAVGHEANRRRPAVVVTSDLINNSPGRLVGVVPVTSTSYALRSHIPIGAETAGLDHESFARCDQVRMVSTSRLVAKRGFVPITDMRSISSALRVIFDI